MPFGPPPFATQIPTGQGARPQGHTRSGEAAVLGSPLDVQEIRKQKVSSSSLSTARGVATC